MSQRLDRVTIRLSSRDISLSSRDISLTWKERRRLLDEVREGPTASRRSISRFAKLKHWAPGTTTIQFGLLELRDALAEEV